MECKSALPGGNVLHVHRFAVNKADTLEFGNPLDSLKGLVAG